MKEFFRGWRRKVGLLTLVLALVFMGGWVRSYSNLDRFSLSGSTHLFDWLVSFKANLAWVRSQPGDQLKGPGQSLPLIYVEVSETRGSDIKWHCRWYGFGSGEYDGMETPANRFTFWTIPYSFVTIPLTLISAFLLLTKPRTSNQKIIAETASNEGE